VVRSDKKTNDLGSRHASQDAKPKAKKEPNATGKNAAQEPNLGQASGFIATLSQTHGRLL
jgi:hypothetical protein